MFRWMRAGRSGAISASMSAPAVRYRRPLISRSISWPRSCVNGRPLTPRFPHKPLQQLPYVQVDADSASACAKFSAFSLASASLASVRPQRRSRDNGVSAIQVPRMRSMTSAGSDPAILIHGAWQGSWVWDRLIPLLARSAGIVPVAVDLPGNGKDGTRPADVSLDIYVSHVGSVLKRLGRRA